MATEKYMAARLPPIGSTQAHHLSPRASVKYEGLSGPSYTLGGKTHLKYPLPAPSVIKPHQDTKAGGLDTWPAHATGQTSSSTSVVLTKHKQLVVVDDELQGKPQMVPKPQFLDQLENFLKKELRSLGVSEVEPSDLRLQAYREVFEYLIEDFKTYKPLLSGIKNEYEMMLSAQREKIRQLEPLKQMLVTVSEQCDQKVMALRDQEKQDVKDLKDENKRLYKRIDDLRQEQLNLEAQVEKLQEELAVEYLRYRDECDSRKLLISDINDLRYQQEDLLVSKQNMQDPEEEKDDPKTLRIALKRAREDEMAASQRLAEMTANYGDVIPRRDFENLQKQYQLLEEKLETLKGDFGKMRQEHDTLLDVHKQVLQQRDDYYVESETLRRSATPRPSWDRCADFVAGGIVRWKDLSANKTSDQLVEVLLNEIQGGAGPEAGGAEYFDGRGEGSSIPKYLQFEGKVRNRRLGKRDCALLVRDIWREKAAQDAERTDGKRGKMSDFVYDYLHRRFGLAQMVVEWGYNLHDACQRYCHDENIGLFFSVLTEEGDEDIYHSQLQMIAKLLNHLTKADVEQGNQGHLSKEDFKEALTKYMSTILQNNSEEAILALIKAAEVELEAKEQDNMEYKNLFMEDDEGKTGPFLDELRQQYKQERIQYVNEIKIEIGSTSPVTMDDLKIAITTTDPEIDHIDMDKYLCWAFNVDDKDQLADTEALESSALMQRLKNGNLRRVGKKS